MTELERRLARPPASAPFDARAATTVLVQRAIEAGLADVAYGWLDSPLGKLIVAVTPRGLVRIAYEREAEEDVLQELAAGVSPRVLRLPERTDAARRELEGYFAGTVRKFTGHVESKLGLMTGFGHLIETEQAASDAGQDFGVALRDDDVLRVAAVLGIHDRPRELPNFLRQEVGEIGRFDALGNFRLRPFRGVQHVRLAFDERPFE